MELSKIFIIAEAGVNHNGSLDMAYKLVDVAKAAGADAVKFQTFISTKVVSTFAEKADYQKKSTDSSETQLDMIKRLEFSNEEFVKLEQYCVEKEILFLSTAFDNHSVRFLDEQLDVPLFKIPSNEIVNGPLILEIAKRQKDILLSTGMSTIKEIENALAVIHYGYLKPDTIPTSFEEILKFYNETDKSRISRQVTLLHCTTEYPAPVSELNLKAIQTLANEFQMKVGFSDHSEGIYSPFVAVALGATVIEKHFTLDKNLEGPDHKASLNPSELKSMVQGIRNVEKSLGNGIKTYSESEMKNLEVMRRSIVSEGSIKKGEVFTQENLGIKRPAIGRKPFDYWSLLGSSAKKDYSPDDPI